MDTNIELMLGRKKEEKTVEWSKQSIILITLEGLFRVNLQAWKIVI